MKFSLLKKDLGKFLDSLSNIVPTNPSLPIIANSLFKIEDSLLQITSTNLEFGITYKIPIKIEEESESKKEFAVPIKTFSKIINSISNEKTITIQITDNNLNIQTSTDNITILIKDANDFPSLPKSKKEKEELVKIESDKLINGFKSVIFAASTTTIRPEFNAVYIYKEEDKIVFVATDQFRLAEKKIQAKTNMENKLLIPLQNVLYLNSILQKIQEKEIYLDIEDDRIIIKTENLHIYSRVLDLSFPNYKAIIPKDVLTKTIFLKSDLTELLSKISIFTDKFGKITINIKDSKLEIYAKNSDIGEIKISPKAQTEGEDIKLSFNYKYIKDATQALVSDSVLLEFAGKTSPLIIKNVSDDSFLYLVMPMVE